MAYVDPKQTVVSDTECFPNYWSIAFRDVETGKVRRFRRTAGCDLDVNAVLAFVRRTRIVSFNGIGYDMPMIALALTGASNAKLKEASDDIIVHGLRHWQFYDKYNCRMPDYLDHIDLMEVSPGSPQKPSLKMYAGRMHSHTIQDLPFDPNLPLSESQIAELEIYHDIDLDDTADMLAELKAQVAIRASMSDQYGVDLRSKSDAQIAEAVIKHEVERAIGHRLEKPQVRAGVFRYQPPAFLKFQTTEMQAMFERVKQAEFRVGADGVVRMPDSLEGATVALGGSLYRMGIGGLHSSEASTTHRSDSEYILIDRDVTSYYPNIILLTGLFPKHMGQHFAKVYRSIYERRVAAKHSGDKNTSETLKIVLNGSFGKFGSPYSILYAPDLMIQTTIGGQLSILMLIESLYVNGLDVVSANTDGFVTKVPRKRLQLFDALILEWEQATGFETEETQYRALHSRDVNNYVAITMNGKVKTKGAFAAAGPGQPGAAGLKKNPQCEVTIDAAVAHLRSGTAIEDTIRACTDVRKFVAVRRVNGGALDQYGRLVGKIVRYYYAGVPGALTYKLNGNGVPKTEGAKPLMTLPDSLPADIDYDWYIREAYAILQDVGEPVLDPALRGRTGKIKALLPGQKTVHVVTLPSGVALCGRKPKGLRETWIESDGQVCNKCRVLLA